jgi:hypothetical protein
MRSRVMIVNLSYVVLQKGNIHCKVECQARPRNTSEDRAIALDVDWGSRCCRP